MSFQESLFEFTHLYTSSVALLITYILIYLVTEPHMLVFWSQKGHFSFYLVWVGQLQALRLVDGISRLFIHVDPRVDHLFFCNYFIYYFYFTLKVYYISNQQSIYSKKTIIFFHICMAQLVERPLVL